MRRFDALLVFDRFGRLRLDQTGAPWAMAFAPSGRGLLVADDAGTRLLGADGSVVFARATVRARWLGFVTGDVVLCGEDVGWRLRRASDLDLMDTSTAILGRACGAIAAIDPHRHHLAVVHGADVRVFRIRATRR